MTIFTGTSGDDVIVDALFSAADSVSGLYGNDTLFGATLDTLNGGGGDELLVAYPPPGWSPVDRHDGHRWSR